MTSRQLGTLPILSGDPSVNQKRADRCDNEHCAQTADRVRAAFVVPVAFDSEATKTALKTMITRKLIEQSTSGARAQRRTG